MFSKFSAFSFLVSTGYVRNRSSEHSMEGQMEKEMVSNENIISSLCKLRYFVSSSIVLCILGSDAI